MNSIILVAIIGLLLIISGYFAFKMLNTKDTKDTTIKNALAAANVTILNGSEHFKDIIVFDTIDKIKNNFETFITTFFPSLDINKMNDMLKNDYGINKSIQQIISSNNNIKMDLYLQIFMMFIMFIVVGSSNKDDLISSGLGFIVINNISDSKNKSYYLDDYDKINDFVIYITPKEYDTNLITSTNGDIKDMYDDNGNKYQIPAPYKISFNKFKKNLAITLLNPEMPNNGSPITTSSIPLTEEQINNLINIVKNNSNSFNKYCRLLLLGPLILQEIPDNKKVFDDIKLIYTNDLNVEIKTYLPPINDETLKTLDFVFKAITRQISIDSAYVTPTPNPVDNALASTGVTQLNTPAPSDQFANEIVVFTLYDDIKDNFDEFITTYYPSLNITEMNRLTDYYIHTDYNTLDTDITINKIISNIETSENKQIPFFNYYFFLEEIKNILILATTKEADFICAGLGTIVLNKLAFDSSEISSNKLYYLGDYEKINDFIIYVVPNDFDEAEVTALNPYIIDSFDNEYNFITFDPPYKFSLNKYSKYAIKYYLNNKNNVEPTEDQINAFLTLVRNNLQSIIKYLRLLLIGPFIRLYTGTIKNVDNDYDLKMTFQYTIDLTTAFNEIDSEVRSTITPLGSSISERINQFNNRIFVIPPSTI